MQLWPPDAQELANGLWPQYHVGAYPYCFRLTTYNQLYAPSDPPALMGQAPGTHWYHAHKHGSTALNVANGMTGAFIIEGQYDDDLRKFYGPKLREQVMMLQQISSTPFPLLNPANTVAPGGARPPISVNGRRNPVVTMQPGEVQLWRIVNGAFRDAVQFLNFTPGESKQPCNPPGCVSWRQIAQDGVQFDFENYNRVGTLDNQFNLATGNRADLLVKAPTQPGTYVLQALANIASPVAIDTASYSFPLLTVKVTSDPVNMDFIRNKEDFPHLLKELPFLADIPESSIFTKRKLVFGAGNTNIDCRPFNPNQISQAMLLNTAEEWTVMNQANDKSHTFHIHINPFQITEIFQPNSVEATQVGNPCYVDPNNPATFKPCPSQQPQAPYVWWDTFAIPTGQQIVLNGQAPPPPAQPTAPAGGNTPLTPTVPICQKLEDCPVALRPYIQCPPYIKGEPYASNAPYCTELIPGYFKMRSRFVDFTGQYVLHCHILIHEDRGMMELIEVVTDKTLYSHH